MAQITTDAVDPEGDTITYYYEWVRNGSPYNNPTARTLNNTVAEGIATAGDSWEVVAYAEDGYSSSDFGYDFVSVGNEPPEITGCVISPVSPQSSDDLTAVALGWDDPDGDPEEYDYTWEVYDSALAAWLPVGPNVSILPASYTNIGDEIAWSARRSTQWAPEKMKAPQLSPRQSLSEIPSRR